MKIATSLLVAALLSCTPADVSTGVSADGAIENSMTPDWEWGMTGSDRGHLMCFESESGSVWVGFAYKYESGANVDVEIAEFGCPAAQDGTQRRTP